MSGGYFILSGVRLPCMVRVEPNPGTVSLHWNEQLCSASPLHTAPGTRGPQLAAHSSLTRQVEVKMSQTSPEHFN